MKKIYLLLASLFFFAGLPAEIVETRNMEEILPYCGEDTWVLFDMDDTLTDSPLYLGSGPWRKFIREKISRYEQAYGPVMAGKNLHDELTFYMADKGPIQPVESELPSLVKELQEQKITALVLTARGSKKWYSSTIEGIAELTHRQLEESGYRFSETLLPEGFELIEKENLDKGVLFAGDIEKGPFLESLIQTSGRLPAKIVFIDDKLAQLASVEQTMQKLGIPYIGVWYRRAEDSHTPFNAVAATFQLEQFIDTGELISDEEAATLTEEFKEQADFYFEEYLKRFDPEKLQYAAP